VRVCGRDGDRCGVEKRSQTGGSECSTDVDHERQGLAVENGPGQGRQYRGDLPKASQQSLKKCQTFVAHFNVSLHFSTRHNPFLMLY
jgi:hypothetical protein